jgi:hypothetical protein
MPENVLSKVRKLVALAARSTNANEAGAAALKACKLIALHGLEVQDAVLQGVAEGIRDVHPPARTSVDQSPPKKVKAKRTAVEEIRDAVVDVARREARTVARDALRDVLGIKRRRR